MNTKIQKTVLAGFIGTAVMTLIMLIAPMMGMPKMLPPKMLSGMMGMPIATGWIMHFMIGISFALFYTFLCVVKDKISNVYLRGVVFGIIAFVIAQIMMVIMGKIMPMPKMEEPMMLMMLGSFVGHIVFGVVVAKVVGDSSCNNSSCKAK